MENERRMMEDEDYESDDTLIDFMLYKYLEDSIPRLPRSFLQPIPKCHEFYLLYVPNMPLNRHRYYFRTTRVEFEYIYQKILETNHDLLHQRKMNDIRRYIHLTLYFLGKNAEVFDMYDRFCISDPIEKALNVCEIINSALYSQMVCWPNLTL